jgi:hypothetical protein
MGTNDPEKIELLEMELGEPEKQEPEEQKAEEKPEEEVGKAVNPAGSYRTRWGGIKSKGDTKL